MLFAQVAFSIVFVHGLNGGSFSTFRSSNNVYWPHDLLPFVVGTSNTRIMTFGYNSNVFTSTAMGQIRWYAERLRIELENARDAVSIARPAKNAVLLRLIAHKILGDYSIASFAVYMS